METYTISEFLHKDKYIISYLIHIPTYKVKTFAFFATFCGGKKLNKNKDINYSYLIYTKKHNRFFLSSVAIQIPKNILRNI